MSSIPIKLICPLGAECESIKDGAIHRCMWYTPVRGTNHNTNEEVDEWRCSLHWLPMLLVENSGMQRQTSKAVVDFRESMMEANGQTQQILIAAAQMQADSKLIEGQK